MADLSTDRRWRARPWVARGVRLGVHAVPFLLVTLAIWRIHLALGPAPDFVTAVARWTGLSLLSTVTLLALDRLARRLLPLATLLQLSLVFPDEAPSRFSLALRQNTTRQLQRDLEAGTLDANTPQEAAQALLAVVAELSSHDRLTRGHTERVRAYTDLIGAELDLSSEERSKLQWSALLHDVGKLRVPAEILNKKGAPNRREWDLIRTHPDEGWQLLKPLRPWLGEWARAARDHHEKWDGSGYPRGLSGAQISRAGRIVAVADAYDVMTSTRSYKSPSSAGDARTELARSAGTHFDPDMVRAFLGLGIGRLRLVMGPLSWLAQLPVLTRLPVGQVPAAAMSTAAAVTVAATSVLAPVEAAPPDEAVAREVASELGELPIMAPASPGDPVLVDSEVSRRRPPSTTTTVPRSTSTRSPAGTTTTMAPGDPMPATTTTGLPTTTTTTAPTTTTSTPGSTTTTTTGTATTTTIATTTTVVPTTTVLPDPFAQAFLGSYGEGPAVLVLPLGGVPVQPWLPNYDSDRDDDPGLTIERGNEGFFTTDPRELQVWALQLGSDYHAVGTPILDIWAATEDFDVDTRGKVEAALVACDAGAVDCTVLSKGSTWFDQSGFGADFGNVTIVMPAVDVTIPASHHIAVAVIVPDESEDDLWFAFDTVLHPSRGGLY